MLRVVCCGPISSRWRRIIHGIGCSVPGSSSVRVDNVPSIKCFPLCLTSSSPLGRILPLFQEGTFPQVPVDLDHPLLYGICCMITDAIQLCLPIKILEGSVVVLVCLNVRVVRGKAEVPAVHEDVLEDIGVSTSQRDSVWG